MKKHVIVIICMLLLPVFAGAQTYINDFDTLPDATYLTTYNGGDGKTHTNFSLETTIVHSGAGALRLDWQVRCYDQYGGWTGINHFHPDSLGYYDFSPYTDLSFWYYVATPSSKPTHVEFRLILHDVGSGTSMTEHEIWISHYQILDSAPGWNHVVVPMKDVGAPQPLNGEGFWNPKWGQTALGNGILELDKIKGWQFEFSFDANYWQAADDTANGSIILDDFELAGAAPINMVFFNGKSLPSNISMYVGWSGTAEISNEQDFSGGTNSIKWTTGNGWDGVNFELAQTRNMIYNWSKDSVQFKIKADAGLGDLVLIFQDPDEDGAVKVDYTFQAIYILTEAAVGYDGNWKQIKIPLKNFNRFNGIWDGDLNAMVPGEFDSTQVKKFMITGNGQAFEGRAVYFDDIWTGNPVFDWVPPLAVQGIGANASAYYNLVYWQDVPGEVGETYNVYASKSPITDATANGVELVETGILENIQTSVHWLHYPLKDANVSYYYAVECVDASGNVGPLNNSPTIMNTAASVPTISLTPPANFVADGDLGEWELSGMRPWILKPETDHIGTGVVDDSLDLKATVYVAMDNDYVYVAADVVDNVFASSATEGNWWNWDALEFFIGLYDWRSPSRHSSILRGAQPDYKLVMMQTRVMNDFNNSKTIYDAGTPNYYFSDLGGSDYVIEAKVPFDSMMFGGDVRFHPQRGMRIPFDLYFHDNDGTTSADWQGNLAYSIDNFDLGWSDPRQWTYTWLGDTTDIISAVENPEIPVGFNLAQNYPNPFNPTTTIEYTLTKKSHVELSIFNVIGQRVRILVNEYQSSGIHSIKWNGCDDSGVTLASGVYIYKIKAGDITQQRKLMFLK